MSINDIDKEAIKNKNFIIVENISKPKITIQNFSNSKEASELKEIKIFKFLTKKRGRKLKKEILENEENKRELYFDNNVHNRFSNDNVKRRLKVLYHKYIISLLNYLIIKRFKKSKMKFVFINSNITKDVSIEFNRSLLNKKIKDIIVNISKKYVDKDLNKKCIKFIESQNDNKELIKILNMSYKDLYEQYYLKSNENNSMENTFEEHKKKLSNLYGKEYLKKFSENAENLIEFFVNGKNRKSKKCEEIKTNDISNDNELSESTTEKNYAGNFEKIFNKKKTVSTGSQTDIENINSRLLFFA